MTMRKNRLDHDILVMLTFSLVTLMTWVGFEIYHTLTKKVIENDIQKYLQTIEPTVNTNILNELQQLNQ